MAYRETEKMRQRKAQVRQRIIDSASQCVASGGFRNAPISRVAALAGVATGTVYRHFESRADLFAEIFRNATQREVDKVAEALNRPGRAAARLEAALRQFARRALRAPTMAWALIAEPVDPKLEEERLRYRSAYAGMLEQAIREGMEAGELPPQDARLSSTCLVGAIAESLAGPLAPARSGEAARNPINNNQLVDTLMHFCMQGLTGRRRPS